jgi:hypothetical protein
MRLTTHLTTRIYASSTAFRRLDYQVRFRQRVLARHDCRSDAIVDAERRFRRYYETVL